MVDTNVMELELKKAVRRVKRGAHRMPPKPEEGKKLFGNPENPRAWCSVKSEHHPFEVLMRYSYHGKYEDNGLRYRQIVVREAYFLRPGKRALRHVYGYLAWVARPGVRMCCYCGHVLLGTGWYCDACGAC